MRAKRSYFTLRRSEPKAPFPTEDPFDISSHQQSAGYPLTYLLLQRRAPRHELKSQTVINHRKSTRSQKDALAVNPDHLLARIGRPIPESSLYRDLLGALIELPSS